MAGTSMPLGEPQARPEGPAITQGERPRRLLTILTLMGRSWGLARPSTIFSVSAPPVVDGRDKPGHDTVKTTVSHGSRWKRHRTPRPLPRLRHRLRDDGGDDRGVQGF